MGSVRAHSPGDAGLQEAADDGGAKAGVAGVQRKARGVHDAHQASHLPLLGHGPAAQAGLEAAPQRLPFQSAAAQVVDDQTAQALADRSGRAVPARQHRGQTSLLGVGGQPSNQSAPPGAAGTLHQHHADFAFANPIQGVPKLLLFVVASDQSHRSGQTGAGP